MNYTEAGSHQFTRGLIQDGYCLPPLRHRSPGERRRTPKAGACTTIPRVRGGDGLDPDHTRWGKRSTTPDVVMNALITSVKNGWERMQVSD